MIGKAISHYKILEELGRGGMGVVYKAEDIKLKRTVALKFLTPQALGSKEEKTRFVHEAQAAAALDHPGICTVHEIDEVDGHLFIAMAYIEGENLKEKIASGPLKLEEAIDFATQIAEGLQEAHEKGAVHRDIKPANIMVTSRNQVKITDFGLSKLSGRTKLTKTGFTMGTAAYMSPEQTHAEDVDGRTDIWSLGAVLYEMLTGQLPFKGDYEQAVVYSIVNEEPEPITGLRSGVPMDLEKIADKCLAKEASERYQRADELLVDLRRVQKESASRTAPSRKAAASHAEKPKKRFPTLFVPGIVAFVAVIIVAGFFFVGRQAESKERIPIAVVDFINETDEKELNGLSGMLITALEQSRRLAVLTRGRMFDILRQLEKGGVEHIDENLGREICRRAGVDLMAIASVRKFGEKYIVDLKVIDHQTNDYVVTAKEEGKGQESVPYLIDKIAEKTRMDLKEKEADIQMANRKVAEVTTFNLEAYQHFFKGEELLNKIKIPEAIEEFQQAIALDSTFGLAYYRLGYAFHLEGRDTEAMAPLQTAVDLIDGIPKKERYLARAYLAHFGHSEEELDQALAILREMEKIYPNDKEMVFFIGDWSYHNRYYATALEYLDRVLSMDPDFRRALIHLAALLRDTGNYERMLEIAQRNKSLGEDITGYWLVGLAHGRLKQFDEAVSSFEKALELVEDPELYRELGYVYTQQNKFSEAEKVFRKALNMDANDVLGRYLLGDLLVKQERPLEAEKVAREFKVETFDFHSNNLLAWVFLMGKTDIGQAIGFSQKAIEINPGKMGPGVHNYRNWARMYPYFMLPEYTLGLAYLRNGQYKEAVEYLEQAAQLAPLRQTIQDDLIQARKELQEATNK